MNKEKERKEIRINPWTGERQKSNWLEPWKPKDELIGVYPTGDYHINVRTEGGTLCLYFEEGLILSLNPERAYNFEQTIHRGRLNIDGTKIADTKTQELINFLAKTGQKKSVKKLEKIRRYWQKHGIEEP